MKREEGWHKRKIIIPTLTSVKNDAAKHYRQGKKHIYSIFSYIYRCDKQRQTFFQYTGLNIADQIEINTAASLFGSLGDQFKRNCAWPIICLR